MKIAENTVVTIDYVIKDDKGNLIEDSSDEPMIYLSGTGSLAPGLEKLLDGKTVGDEIQALLDPTEAFGEFEEDLIQEVSMEDFDDPSQVEEGLAFHAEVDDEIRMYVVKEVRGDVVVIDGNHPLAGQTLDFSVSIKDIREATEEELAHGHVHDGDGHHHDH